MLLDGCVDMSGGFDVAGRLGLLAAPRMDVSSAHSIPGAAVLVKFAMGNRAVQSWAGLVAR
jgi:hypothetical protein